MKFYLDTTTGKWVIGSLTGVPAGTCTEETDPVTGKITIRNDNGGVFHNSDGYYSFLPTEFQDSAGNSYADKAAYLTATKAFFIGPTNTGSGSGGADFKAFSVEITRPANTTVYAANDVVADVTAAFLPFLNAAKAVGAGIKVLRVRIQTEDTGVAGKKFNLHLYRDAPTFIADNAAFAISYANASKRIGAIPVVMGTGNLGTVGMNDYNQVIINPVAKDVYFILETVDGFTPSGNSTKFQVTIDCELSN